MNSQKNTSLSTPTLSHHADSHDSQPNSTIIDYYENCESDYKFFWRLKHSMAMHAGFWDNTTDSLAAALQRENEVLAEIARIGPGDSVLDAGCGVGGSSIFLASRYGCRATGITLSRKQTETARSNAFKHGVGSLVSFHVRDYCDTEFPEASFDVIWGIESVCHAQDKALFAKEAYRLLKPGGRLIIADGFALKNQYSIREGAQMKKWLNGWGVDSLDTVETFERVFHNACFEQIEFQDATKNVLPSSRRLYYISFPAMVFSKIGEWLGMRKKIQTNNILGAYYQYITLQQQLWKYGIFSAKKRQ